MYLLFEGLVGWTCDSLSVDSWRSGGEASVGNSDDWHSSADHLSGDFTFPFLRTMEATSSSSRSKHKRSHDKDRGSSSRKRVKHKHHSKKSSKNEDHLHVVDDDVDEDMWVEKNVDMDGEKVLSDGSTSWFANRKA